MNSKQESTLIKRCQKGDRHALEALLGQYQKPVYNVAYRILGNRDDAADATQAVFLKAIENLDRYKPEYRFFSWIYRIAINESINQSKRGRRQQPLGDHEVRAKGGPDTEAEALDLSREIQDGLMELNENYRTVIVLRHFMGLSYHEISDVVQLPEKTVKSRLYSARQLMKKSLSTSGLH